MNAWENESNQLDWTDEKTGLRCHMQRNHFKAWCGYVEIPAGHPLHGVAYNEELTDSIKHLKDVVMDGPIGKRGPMNLFMMAGDRFSAGDLFDVHGSVTYSGGAFWIDGKPGHWYGFDCSHAGDLSPKDLEHYGPKEGDVYRDAAYVKAECESLARQIAGVAS